MLLGTVICFILIWIRLVTNFSKLHQRCDMLKIQISGLNLKKKCFFKNIIDYLFTFLQLVSDQSYQGAKKLVPKNSSSKNTKFLVLRVFYGFIIMFHFVVPCHSETLAETLACDTFFFYKFKEVWSIMVYLKSLSKNNEKLKCP